jgi:tetratricopeptide (TPR) repeat protein
MLEAEQALREAELLVADSTEVGKQAPLARTQGELYLRRGEHQLALAAFRRQTELWRRAGAPFPEHIALGNVGCAQLDAGELDEAIESLRKSVDGLRGVRGFFLEFRLSWLAVALAWRGDDLDVLTLARESFDFLLDLGLTFAPLMAAALQHLRCGDSQRAVLLTGFAYSRLPQERVTRPTILPVHMHQRMRERATAEHSAATVETWLRAGERLTAEQAAAIAFDGAALEVLCREPGAMVAAADSNSTPSVA